MFQVVWNVICTKEATKTADYGFGLSIGSGDFYYFFAVSRGTC